LGVLSNLGQVFRLAMWADREPAQVLAAGSCSVCWVGSTGWVVFSCVQLCSDLLTLMVWPIQGGPFRAVSEEFMFNRRGFYVEGWWLILLWLICLALPFLSGNGLARICWGHSF